MFYFHKGLSRQTCRTVGRALALAGHQGCTAADTGHLLIAILETDTGPAADFLHGKRITLSMLQGCTGSRSCTGTPRRLSWKGPGAGQPQGAGVCAAGGAGGPGPQCRERASALRHAGGLRLHGQCLAGAAGGGGSPGRARVPSDLRAAGAAGPAPDEHHPLQPPQREVRPGPDPPGAGGQAGPGTLPGRGAGTDGGDPLPPAEEQSLSAGGAGRGQERPGGGAGPAHCPGQCDPEFTGQAGAGAGHGIHGGGHQIPGRF